MRVSRLRFPAITAVALLISQTFLSAPSSWAQDNSQQNQTQQNQQKQQQQQKPTDDQSAPEAGGPGNDTGPIAIPKKGPAKTEAPPPPATVKNPPGLDNYSLRVDVPVVNVDVNVITEKTHQFIPNLDKDNFRVFEDGVPQQIVGFHQVKAPITAVLLLEFAANDYNFIFDMWNAAVSFTNQLQPNDYVAVVTYDMHTNILTDFTQNKMLVAQSVQSLQIPTWQETNEFDALYETLDRLTRIDGRKYIILVSSGVDTFSKITLDKILQKIKETPNVTIFSIATGGAGMYGAGNFASGRMNNITMLQAQNELQSFARMTGGMYFQPRFDSEFPDVFTDINNSIRNQYQITYRPTNSKMDGSWRRIQIQLVDQEGHQLRMVDEKHKPLKYDIIARDGYRAKRQVE
ncbi:MAG TPA: VWA domain-containing protein [Acidobacteriaceae bacterium]|jgi:VWFA-related protein|nr:VWA domain-containing protein [Acidobacteriaceae bacterium]